jgi:hypothetical protein
MPRRRLNDRIEDLVAKVVVTYDDDELEEIFRQLREALHEHTERLRKLAAKKLTSPPKNGSGEPSHLTQ